MKQLKPQYIGLITASLMIAASLFAFYIIKLPVESNFQFVVYIIFVTGVVGSLFNYHTNKLPNKKFKDYFSAGFKTFVIVALLMAVYTYIFFSFNTAFRDIKIEENNKLIIAQGNHLPREIEENARQLKQLFMPIMVSSAVFRYLIIGALISLAGAGFLSKNSHTEKV